jgi:hypothetical protein
LEIFEKCGQTKWCHEKKEYGIGGANSAPTL